MLLCRGSTLLRQMRWPSLADAKRIGERCGLSRQASWPRCSWQFTDAKRHAATSHVDNANTCVHVRCRAERSHAFSASPPRVACVVIAALVVEGLDTQKIMDSALLKRVDMVYGQLERSIKLGKVLLEVASPPGSRRCERLAKTNSASCEAGNHDSRNACTHGSHASVSRPLRLTHKLNDMLS